MSSFFEEPPPEPAATSPDLPRWARLSSHWLLSPLNADAVLARTKTVVLYVYLVRACPDAFSFRLLAAPAEGHRLDLFAFSMTAGMLRYLKSAEETSARHELADTPFANMFRRSPNPLTLDIELADGTRASTTEAFEAVREGRERRGTILVGSGGGSSGDGSALTAEWAVAPLPTVDATLVVEWGDEGVSRVDHVISGRVLADAAARSVRLTPGER